MKKNIQTTIEVTDTHVKLVQSKGGPLRPTLIGVEIKPIMTPTDEGLIKAIFDASRSRAISAESFLFVIPRRFVILKRLRLPSHNDIELRKMIGLQLVNQIPYSIDEVTFDYQVLEKDSQGYTDVLALIVNRSITKRYIAILEQAGLKSGRMTVSSFGLVNWWRNQCRLKKVDPGGAVLLVNIDFAHTEICFCQNDKLFSSRSINYGERDLTQEGMTNFSKQISLSYTNYQRQKMGPEIKKICVISNLAETALLKQQLERDLGSFVEMLSPLENIPALKRLNLPNIHNHPGLALAVCLGFQFADPKQMMNLTPREVHEGKQLSVRKREWVMFVVLLFTAFVLGAGIFGVETYFKNRTLTQLKKQNSELQPKMQEVERRINFLKAINEKLSNRILVAKLMDQLYSITPSDISYRSILLDERRTLTLQGYAQTSGGSGVNAFQEALVRSKDFSAVNLEFATKRRIFNMEVTDFKIVINLGKTDK